jgi:plasmid maintenance system killer protein
MKVTFNDKGLEELYKTSEGKWKRQFSKEVITHYQRKIEILKNADDLGQIAKIKGLNLEKLKGKGYIGCYSIRVNEQYRIIFRVSDKGTVAILII